MREITGERRRKVNSGNMYKGPMDKDNGWWIEYGRWGAGMARDSNGGEIGTTVIEQ